MTFFEPNRFADAAGHLQECLWAKNWKGAEGIPTKGTGQKLLNFSVISGCFQGIFRVFSGFFQGIFRVFSGCFSLCPFWVCPLDPPKKTAQRVLRGVLLAPPAWECPRSTPTFRLLSTPKKTLQPEHFSGTPSQVAKSTWSNLWGFFGPGLFSTPES